MNDNTSIQFSVPGHVNELFTGIYVIDLTLVSLFLTVEDENMKNPVRLPQAIIVVVLLMSCA